MKKYEQMWSEDSQQSYKAIVRLLKKALHHIERNTEPKNHAAALAEMALIVEIERTMDEIEEAKAA